jgi:arsenate reductase
MTAASNVLVICTHNSACSVLAEGMLNHWAKRLAKDVRGYSAGSAPSGRINPHDVERPLQLDVISSN